VRMKQHPAQKRQREVKAASCSLYPSAATGRLGKSITNPWRTAPRQMSKIGSSLTWSSPSDKKIMTGVLQSVSAYRCH
jgi:hypothetical protein